MEVLEVRVSFEKVPGFNEEEFVVFSEKAKKEGYENVFRGKNIMTCFDSKKTKIILNNKELIYNIENPTEKETEQIGSVFERMLEGLVDLTEKAYSHIRIIDAEKVDYSTYEKSKNISMPFDDVKGIGYRYFIQHEKGLGDFKFEPLIRNDNVWFFEATYVYNKFKILSELQNYIEYVITDFNNRKNIVLDGMLS